MCRYELGSYQCLETKKWVSFLEKLPQGVTASDHEAAYRAGVPSESYIPPPLIPGNPCDLMKSTFAALRRRGIIS